MPARIKPTPKGMVEQAKKKPFIIEPRPMKPIDIKASRIETLRKQDEARGGSGKNFESYERKASRHLGPPKRVISEKQARIEIGSPKKPTLVAKIASKLKNL